jgi:4'-phosphopantetheinyl transferase
MDYSLSIKQISAPGLDRNWLSKVINEEMFTNQDARVTWGADGKPWLENPRGYFISGSNSGEYIAVALSEKPIGVDIEFKKKRIPELLLATTDENERSQLKVHGANNLLASWTAKESAQKADTKIHGMNDYKITVNRVNPMHYTIRRGSIEWHGVWRFENYYICALAILE